MIEELKFFGKIQQNKFFLGGGGRGVGSGGGGSGWWGWGSGWM